MLLIQYDERKKQKKIRIHGLSFEIALIAFDDPNAVIIYDGFHQISQNSII